MSDIPAPLREQVVLRAGHRCEYCGLSQAGQETASAYSIGQSKHRGGVPLVVNELFAERKKVSLCF